MIIGYPIVAFFFPYIVMQELNVCVENPAKIVS